jgi:hypothetical protein
MTDDSSSSPASLDEQLVAYLDGELDAESRRRVEELLTSEAQVRRRLQELERTWDILDDLDAGPPSGQLTQTTLEMVALAARQDVRQSLAEAPRRRRRRWLAVGLGFLVALAGGFFAVVWLVPDPNRQLVEDLPLLENLDEYRQIDDIQFLRLLRSAGLFVGRGETPGGTAPPAVESLAQRRQRIESMGLGEKAQLLRLDERFLAMDQDQQRQLRQLHQAIQDARDAAQLRQIMHHYYEWLKTLPLYTRTELGGLEPAERLEAVKKRLKDEHGQRLGDQDSEALWRWMNRFALQHEKQLLDRLPELRRKELTNWTPQARQPMLLALMDVGWRRQSTGPGRPPPLMTEEDLASLRGELSAEMRLYLESLSKTKQWQQVAAWMHHAVRQQHAHADFWTVNDERLADFFEKELSDDERDRLLSLPGDEMQRELQRLYLTRTKPPEGSPRRGHPPTGERPAKKKTNKSSPAAKAGG